MASASCGRHRRHAGFDPVDADFVHLAGDANLVIDGKHDSGGLLAVSQRRVVDLDLGGQVQVLADFGHEIVGADPPFAVFEMSFAHRFPQGNQGQFEQRHYTHFSFVPKEKTTFYDDSVEADSGSTSRMSEILLHLMPFQRIPGSNGGFYQAGFVGAGLRSPRKNDNICFPRQMVAIFRNGQFR